jgi:hypothetical protein
VPQAVIASNSTHNPTVFFIVPSPTLSKETPAAQRCALHSG